MNTEGNRRLLVLAEFLETLPPAEFAYAMWAGRTDAETLQVGCGTRGCALGWATAIPEFQALGLRLVSDCFGTVYVSLNATASWRCAEEAGRTLFELTSLEFDTLFVPRDPDYDEGEDESEVDATPRYVAAKIRTFVAQRT